MRLIMTNVEINDPWFESVYRSEFNANPVKFLETFKILLLEKHRREKKTVSLLKKYAKAEMSVGKIAENLGIDREEVWALMKKYNVDLVDYSWKDEAKNVDNFLSNY